MMRKFFFLFLLFFAVVGFCKLPQLTPHDTFMKIQEILHEHVKYSSMNEELMKRVFQNFFDELDPSKTYLIESEIQPWLNPSNKTLETFLEDFNQGQYKRFDELYQIMVRAIERRAFLEKEISTLPLPKINLLEEQKTLSWAKDQEELKERLLKIKALQLLVSEKLKEEKQDLFALLKKRRLHREKEILGSSDAERKILVLTYVLKSTCSALDAHTTYFTPTEADLFMIQVQQSLVGIGAQLKDHLNGFQVVRLIEKSPAIQPGKLKINDLIVAVNQEPVIGLDVVEVVERIRGEKGTPVSLTILRNDEEQKVQKLEIVIKRGEIVLEESRFESSFESFADGIIAHLRLFSFYQDPKSSSFQDLKNVLVDLKKKHLLKGVILDLRNNAGGLLPQAVAVSGLFITKGVVVSIQDHTGEIQHLRNTEEKMVWDGPLIVLTNKASASAAEIVAQTLQDYGRALIVGDSKTFGKGSFQTFTLDTIHQAKVNPQGEFKVTRGLYYTVSGKSPQLKGVLPDLVIPGILSEVDIGEEFSKFPLPNDSISPHFEDDLSDIPPVHRNRIALLYKNHLQQKLSLYTPYLDLLKKNSAQRLLTNAAYQTFLKKLKQKSLDLDLSEEGGPDLQLLETYNVMKDLIFLSELHEKYAASY